MIVVLVEARSRNARVPDAAPAVDARGRDRRSRSRRSPSSRSSSRRQASARGILTRTQFQLVVAVAVLTHARSRPRWSRAAARSATGSRRGSSKAGSQAGKTVLPPPAAPACRAVVVGYGPVGRTLCKILIRFGVQTCVVDLDLKTVQRLTTMGREAVFGDATRREVLDGRRAPLGALPHRHARPISRPAPAIIASARAVNPSISVISRARYLEERGRLEETGASHIAYEEAEVAAELARLLLKELDVRDGSARRRGDEAPERDRGPDRLHDDPASAPPTRRPGRPSSGSGTRPRRRPGKANPRRRAGRRPLERRPPNATRLGLRPAYGTLVGRGEPRRRPDRRPSGLHAVRTGSRLDPRLGRPDGLRSGNRRLGRCTHVFGPGHRMMPSR